MNRSTLIVLLSSLCGIAPTWVFACTLQPVAIELAATEPAGTYIGKTSHVGLQFHNHKTSGVVEVFPEPPLWVRQLSVQAECAIDAGGVWVRHHVYAASNGRTLVTHEYNGSNDDLNFYDTLTCRKRASIHVSDVDWVVDEGAVLIARAAGERPSRAELDAACVPIRPSSAVSRAE